MIIRSELPEDYAAVMNLTYKAFLTLNFPGRRRPDEHFLIHLLKDSTSVVRELSFVAVDDGEIIGHILYTKSEILRSDDSKSETITFGPLSVLPERQKQGIGRALVQHSMEKARELGFGAVLITGVPDYYPKLGFKRARDFGLVLTDGTAEDYFMAYELTPGYLSGGGTLRFLAPEFEQAENDDAGYETFHKQFMAKFYPGKLMLRPFFDGDIELMERWLNMPHVAKWYKHPEHWLNELRERHGEFSFLTHFIAEFEGVPVGFCQYYDCYFAQKHEIWNDQWRVGEKEGEIYSIDCLIGEPEFLRRGFGTQMVRQMLEMLRRIGAKIVIAEPERENIASNEALRASGFSDTGVDYFLELDDLR